MANNLITKNIKRVIIEGKFVLFKELGSVAAFPICLGIKTQKKL